MGESQRVSALLHLTSIRNWLARLGPPSLQSAVHFEIGELPENGSDKHQQDFQLFSLQQSLWYLGLYVCILFVCLIAFVLKVIPEVGAGDAASSCYLSNYRAIFGVAAQIGMSLPIFLLLRRWSGRSPQQLRTQAPSTFLKRLRCVMLLPFLLSIVLCSLEDFNVRLVTGGGLDPVLAMTIDCSPGRTIPLESIADWNVLMLQLAIFAYFAQTLLPTDIAVYVAAPLSLLALTFQSLAMNEVMDRLEYRNSGKQSIFLEVALWTLPILVILCVRTTQERTALLVFEVLNHQHRATTNDKVLPGLPQGSPESSSASCAYAFTA